MFGVKKQKNTFLFSVFIQSGAMIRNGNKRKVRDKTFAQYCYYYFLILFINFHFASYFYHKSSIVEKNNKILKYGINLRFL